MVAWWWLIVAFVGGVFATIAMLVNPYLNWIILWILDAEVEEEDDDNGSIED